ncbi:hypothetical protein F4553_001807 [Allocatelliglobosispora scoriae]|uniref:Uncharacterized protein n=1 Tax=Allocatelliglobosispora scoriae TaxID=643052 RepID=A0A841BM45_9ACTN|nr:hypothetical protein [Allocatelliglobosispora scoriae]MBB5868428.1 hypothetical protein [Allocatelliglobosispora scoriae]
MKKWAILSAAAVLAGVAIQSPAEAVAGIQYVTSASATDSSAAKTVVLYCPTGTVSIGGGAYLTGATGQATIRQIAPTTVLGRNALVVIGAEDSDGYSGTWNITATNVCIPTPAGFRYVRVTVSDPSLVWATADCTGQRVIGSGYTVSSTAKAMATGIEIDTRNRAYLSVEPSSVPGAVTPITGTVTAACADAQLPGTVQTSASTPQDSSNPQTVTVTCPTGTQIVHIGGDLWRVRGHSVIDDFRIIQPNMITVTGYEDELGNPDIWATEAYATCAA